MVLVTIDTVSSMLAGCLDELMGKYNSPYSHAFLDIGRRDALAEVDDKLCYLFDVDDIFALL